MRTITPTVAFLFFFFAWLNLLHIEVKIKKLTFGETWTWCQVKTIHVCDAVKKNESLCAWLLLFHLNRLLITLSLGYSEIRRCNRTVGFTFRGLRQYPKNNTSFRSQRRANGHSYANYQGCTRLFDAEHMYRSYGITLANRTISFGRARNF